MPPIHTGLKVSPAVCAKIHAAWSQDASCGTSTAIVVKMPEGLRKVGLAAKSEWEPTQSIMTSNGVL